VCVSKSEFGLRNEFNHLEEGMTMFQSLRVGLALGVVFCGVVALAHAADSVDRYAVTLLLDSGVLRSRVVREG
jgi:hypothetical protein